MKTHEAALARMRLDYKLALLREMALEPPPKGWIKAIRESLGMTAHQLAGRLSVAPSRIFRIQQDEITGATTLKTLRLTAAAMSCDVFYAVVPFKPLNDILLERAVEKAREHSLFASLRGIWDD